MNIVQAAQRCLKELKSVVQEDEFWGEVETEFAVLSQKLERDKPTDMMKFQREIRMMLEKRDCGKILLRERQNSGILEH